MAVRKKERRKRPPQPKAPKVPLHIQIEDEYDRGAAWASYLSTMSFLRHEEEVQQMAHSLRRAGKPDTEIRRTLAERDRSRRSLGYFVGWF